MSPGNGIGSALECLTIDEWQPRPVYQLHRTTYSYGDLEPMRQLALWSVRLPNLYFRDVAWVNASSPTDRRDI